MSSQSTLVPTPDDPGARFDALVREHHARLCKFAYRFVESRDVAQDLVQEVLLRVWRHHDTFNYGDPLPYLYQAIRNRATTHLRHRRVRDRWRERVQREGEPVAAAPDTDVEGAELRRLADEAVKALPDRCRLIFTMSREQHLSYAEIARLLGISVNTVETQMGRALRTLRARLAPFLALVLTLSR